MRYVRGRSTGIGETPWNDERYEHPIGEFLNDPFFDSEEEMLTCCDILDLVGLHTGDAVKIVIKKDFLKRLVKSHIGFLKELDR